MPPNTPMTLAEAAQSHRADFLVRGALADIDDEVVRRAHATVQRFDVRSLGLPIRSGKGPVGPRRPNPQLFVVRDGGDDIGLQQKHGFFFSDDILQIPTHGSTHLDALSHIWRDGKMFGGVPSTEVTSRGARRLGIDVAGPIVTRVFIVDGVPSGRRWLEPGEGVDPDLLRARIRNSGITPERGDAMFVRTGWVEAWYAGAQDETGWGGLDVDVIDWVVETGFSVLGADNVGVEMSPASTPDCTVPLHVGLLRDHGIYFCELADLGDYVDTCAVGMLIISPLRIVGGSASPVAPVVIF